MTSEKSETNETEVNEQEEKLPRVFPNTQNVYHFHPIAFVNHIKLIFGEGGSSEVCYAELRVRAFMRMIRKCEGTDKEIGYQTIYSHKLFSDYGKDMSTHPNESVEAGGYKSDAAGAYQIRKAIYDGIQTNAKKYGITGFDEKAQDELCLVILKHNYTTERHNDFFHTKKGVVREDRKKYRGLKADIIQKIIDNDINYALFVSCLCWASLPNAPYGQPAKTLTQVKKMYSDYLIEEIQGNTSLHLESGFLSKFGYDCCNDSSSMMPPWLEIALSRAIMVQGADEAKEPLFTFAKSCLEFSGSSYAPTHDYGQWCGAFVSWCISTAGYKTGQKGGQMTNSQKILALAEKGIAFKKIEEPVVGCIVVLSNYYDSKKAQYEAGEKPESGHVTFLYGISGDWLICLGGNQGNSLKFSGYNKVTGAKYSNFTQKVNSFLMPIDYPEANYITKIPKTTTSKTNKKFGINTEKQKKGVSESTF